MKDETALLQEAYALYQAGMRGAALAVCEEIIARESHSAMAHYWAGFACLGLGRMDQAIAQYQEAVRRDPSNAEFYFGLAGAYESRGFREGERLRALQRASTLAMAEWQHQMFEGELAKAEGDYSRALTCFRQAALSAPERYEMGKEIGQVLYLMKRVSEARDILRASVALPTATDMTWLNLGRCEQKLGDFGAAAAAFERSLALNPYNRFALFRLMQVSFIRGHWLRGFRELAAFWRLFHRTVIEDKAALVKN